MAANFSRLKTWASLEILHNEDLNAEFNNIINSLSNTTLDDYSSSVGQMQIQTTPGGVGSESLATSLAGELERIRFVIARITGKTYWYEAPSRNLDATSPSFSFYFPFDENFGFGLDPQQTIQRGAVVESDETAMTFTAFDSSVAKFGKYSLNTATGPSGLCAYSCNPMPEGTLGVHFYNYAADKGIAYNPLTGAELKVNSSGFLQLTQFLSTPLNETTKNSLTVTGTNLLANQASWKHVLLKYRMNGIAGTGTDRFKIRLDGVTEGTDLTAQTAPANIGDGGAWFVGGKRQDPTWTAQSAFSVLPAAEASPWTKVGTGTEAVVGGVLSMSSIAGTQLNYTKTNGVNFSNGNSTIIDFKMRFDAQGAFSIVSPGAVNDIPFTIRVRDDSEDRAMLVGVTPNGFQFFDGTATNFLCFVAFDTTKWRTYRLQFKGNGGAYTVALWVDGVRTGSEVLSNPSWTTVDATAGDQVAFGDFSAASGAMSAEFEYFRHGTIAQSTDYPPVQFTSTNGRLDDAFLISSDYDNASLDALFKDSQASSVLSKDKRGGPFHYYVLKRRSSVTNTSQTITANQNTASQFMSTVKIVGDGVTAVHVTLSAIVSSSAINGDIMMYFYPNINSYPQTIANAGQNVGNMGGFSASFNPATAAENSQITCSGSFIPKAGENTYGVSFTTGGTAANRTVSNISISVMYEPVQFN